MGDVVFENRARLTLNQSPMKLLDGNFRGVVLQAGVRPKVTGWAREGSGLI